MLAPSSIAEAVELVADAFEIAERYRTPVMLLADGVMGQAMEPVVPTYRTPAADAGGWELTGADGRPPRVVRSLHLRPEDLEAHNRHLQAKFATIAEREVRWAGEHLDDAEIVDRRLRHGGARRADRDRAGARARARAPACSGRSRLWPFPSDGARRARAADLRAILVVELSAGQMVEDVRLAVEGRRPVFFHGRTGGMVPTPGEVVDALRRAWALTAAAGDRPRRRRRRGPTRSA